MNKSDHLISWITGLTTLVMALFSFILSFNALAALAEQYSISIPPFIPLIIEGGVVVFSLNALWRSLHAIQARWQWALIIGSSLLAGVFNVIHAPADVQPVTVPLIGLALNPARVMAALPSLFLLLSFETFLSQIRNGVKFNVVTVTLERLEQTLRNRQEEVNNTLNELNTQLEQRRAEIDTAVTKLRNSKQTAQERLDKLLAEIEQRQQELNRLEQLQVERVQSGDSTDERRQKLVNILAQEGNIGPTAFAQRLNVARNTVYNDLTALEQSGVIHRNGDGWRVSQ